MLVGRTESTSTPCSYFSVDGLPGEMGVAKDIKLSEGAAPDGPKKRGRKRLHSPHKKSAPSLGEGGQDSDAAGVSAAELKKAKKKQRKMQVVDVGPKPLPSATAPPRAQPAPTRTVHG